MMVNGIDVFAGMTNDAIVRWMESENVGREHTSQWVRSFDWIREALRKGLPPSIISRFARNNPQDMGRLLTAHASDFNPQGEYTRLVPETQSMPGISTSASYGPESTTRLRQSAWWQAALSAGVPDPWIEQFIKERPGAYDQVERVFFGKTAPPGASSPDIAPLTVKSTPAPFIPRPPDSNTPNTLAPTVGVRPLTTGNGVLPIRTSSVAGSMGVLPLLLGAVAWVIWGRS